jgi:hypothetical protein
VLKTVKGRLGERGNGRMGELLNDIFPQIMQIVADKKQLII